MKKPYNRIRYFRKLYEANSGERMSPYNLAKRLGITKYAVYLWEKQETQPNEENALKLSEIFKIREEDLWEYR